MHVMSIASSLSSSHIAALVVAAVACGIDLRTRRIPNALTFGAAALALVYHAVTGGASGVASSAGGWIAGVAVLIIPYLLGGMGAGDVKLLGALGAWLGPGDALWAGVYATVAGAGMALVVSLAHGYLGHAVRNVWLMLMEWRVGGIRPIPELTLAEGRGPRLAYAAPILVGTVAVLWLR